MKRLGLAILLGLALSQGGCLKTKRILMGGDRQMFFQSGTAVPGVKAEENTGGYYLLKSEELDALLNP